MSVCPNSYVYGIARRILFKRRGDGWFVEGAADGTLPLVVVDGEVAWAIGGRHRIDWAWSRAGWPRYWDSVGDPVARCSADVRRALVDEIRLRSVSGLVAVALGDLARERSVVRGRRGLLGRLSGC